jgi:hypothetical protein
MANLALPIANGLPARTKAAAETGFSWSPYPGTLRSESGGIDGR